MSTSRGQIEDHLRRISKLYKKVGQDEVQLFCPFCGDAVRKPNPKHGHLYVNFSLGVFHCFRCNASGTLYRLLIETGFSDTDVLQQLSKKGATYFVPRTVHSSSYDSLVTHVVDQNIKFSIEHPEQYLAFKRYLANRGIYWHPAYLLAPTLINNQLAVACYSTFGGVVTRLISSKVYFRSNIHYYAFQPISDLVAYESVTFCEGPFDALRLYAANSLGPSFFIAMLGKSIVGIRNFLDSYLQYDDVRINIVLDSDVKLTDYMRKMFIDYDVKWYRSYGKDPGEQPALTCLNSA